MALAANGEEDEQEAESQPAPKKKVISLLFWIIHCLVVLGFPDFDFGYNNDNGNECLCTSPDVSRRH